MGSIHIGGLLIEVVARAGLTVYLIYTRYKRFEMR